MSKKEMDLFTQRWEKVRLRQLKELRRTTVLEKFRQLNQLIASLRLFRGHNALDASGVQEVRKRWILLKTKLTHRA